MWFSIYVHNVYGTIIPIPELYIMDYIVTLDILNLLQILVYYLNLFWITG